jgi:hypothetical protein
VPGALADVYSTLADRYLSEAGASGALMPEPGPGADYGTRKLLGPLDLEREKEFYADDVVALVAKLFGPEIAGGSLAQADDSRVAEIAAEIRRRYEANLPEEPPPADQAAWQRAVPVYDELSELRKTLLTASRDALKDAVSSVAE